MILSILQFYDTSTRIPPNIYGAAARAISYGIQGSREGEECRNKKIPREKEGGERTNVCLSDLDHAALRGGEVGRSLRVHQSNILTPTSTAPAVHNCVEMGCFI